MPTEENLEEIIENLDDEEKDLCLGGKILMTMQSLL